MSGVTPTFLSTLLFGIKEIYSSGALKGVRTRLNFIGFTVTDDPANGRVNIEAPDAGLTLSNTAPAAVAAAGAVGVATTAAHGDHVHAHGNQLGGGLHAVAIASGAAGFMSGADKAALDSAVAVLEARDVDPTEGTIAVRGSDGSLQAVDFTGGSLNAAAGQDVALTASGGAASVIADEAYITSDFVECSGQVSSAIEQSAAVTGAVALDANKSNHHRIGPITGNITIDMSNIRSGGLYSIEVVQGTTGEHTVSFNARFKFGDTYTAAAKTGGTAVSIWEFRGRATDEVRCIGKETYTS